MEHYCQKHSTKYYRNEKNGQHWYSHKTDDPAFPRGYCNEPEEKQTSINAATFGSLTAPRPQGVPVIGGYEDLKVNSMYACNAMNNAIALVNGGKVDITKLDSAYKRILTILEGKKEPEDLDNWPEGQ